MGEIITYENAGEAELVLRERFELESIAFNAAKRLVERKQIVDRVDMLLDAYIDIKAKSPA